MLMPQDLLREVVEDLGPLSAGLVFTGGSTVWLYFERPKFQGEIRKTDDADVVVAVASYVEYSRLLERLRERGVSARAGQEGPTCRVITPRGHVLDVIPSRHEVLGFGNPWFEEGVRRAVLAAVDPDLQIRIFPAPVFFAAKASAYLDRGAKDPWTSDDLHDLLVLLDCRPSLPGEIASDSGALRAAIAAFARGLVAGPALDELIAGHLGASAPGWRERVGAVQAALEALTAL
ncbi:MAG: hypothetical protein FJZ01_18995 [Candidatus Sericytochromatia bacterium]|nr:hypothetical protein [Candidatus Tanganyikabacteria bacterium]